MGAEAGVVKEMTVPTNVVAGAAKLEPPVDPAIAIRRKNRRINWVGRVVVMLICLGLWQLIGSHMDPLALSTPARVARRMVELFHTGGMASNMLETAKEVGLGYAFGSLAGIVLGFTLASNERLNQILDPFVVAVYGLPKIALLPLFIVWFGIGLGPKVVLAALLVFFMLFFSTFHGVTETDPDLIYAIRLLGATPGQVRRWVVAPSALSAIFLGLKMAGPEALVGAVVAEMLVSSNGVGYTIQYAASQLDTPGVFAGLVVLTVMAMVLNWMVNSAYRWITKKRQWMK